MKRRATVEVRRAVGTPFALVTLLVLFLSGAARAQLTPGDHIDRTLVFDGETRLYDVHVPPGYDGSSPVPLVADLHGRGSNKTDQASISGFKAVSDVEGFIVAYPLGLFGDASDPEAQTGSGLYLAPCWNVGPCCGQCSDAGVDDVGFLRALVTAIAAEANIDLRRVYATGLSNGGTLSHVLACDASDVFTAAAPLASSGPFAPIPTCQPPRPIAVMQFSGTDDQVVPFDGCSPTTTPCIGDPNLVVSSAVSMSQIPFRVC